MLLGNSLPRFPYDKAEIRSSVKSKRSLALEATLLTTTIYCRLLQKFLGKNIMDEESEI